MDRLSSPDVKRNCFVPISGRGKKSCRIWVAKVVLLLRVSNRGSKKSQEHFFLQYMSVIRMRAVANQTLGCVCLWYSTDYKVNHSLRGRTTASKEEGLSRGIVRNGKFATSRNLSERAESKSYDCNIYEKYSVAFLSEHVL